MGRKTSGQQVGLQSIGNVQANANTLTTTQTNQDLTIAPNGTGTLFANSDFTILNQGDLRLRESSGNGTNYIAQHAAASMAANYTITWPDAVAATTGFVLSSDTSGNLSWVSAAGQIPVADPGSTATVHYPLFGTNAGSVPTVLSPQARSNLKFIPSTGELEATIGHFDDVIGSSANSGTLTIRGTSSATKATASVRMTDNVSSSSTTTGTLVVTGGVGVSGRATIDNISVTANTNSSSTTSGSLTVTGGIGATGNIYASAFYGSGANLTGLALAGRLLSVNVYTTQNGQWNSVSSSGTSATWNRPAGCTNVLVYVTGGGGGCRHNNNDYRGAGGGGGATAIRWLDVTNTSSVSVNVGGGGGHNYGGRGNTGGTSTFGPFVTATGGQGGITDNPYEGGPGGDASGGDINLPGGGGEMSHGSNREGGGGMSFWFKAGSHHMNQNSNIEMLHGQWGSGGSYGYYSDRNAGYGNGGGGAVIVYNYS
jgi:hypothetical protein